MLKDDDYKRISFRFAPYLAWTSLIYLSHGQIFISDEEFVILVTLEPKKKIQTFRFLAKLTQNLTLMRTPCLIAMPVPLSSMVYTNILIDYS